MAQVPIYNEEGKTVGEAAIAERIAGRQPHPQIVHEYVVAVQGNQRHWAANARDRSQVRGSTAKPWRQKGTGRARAGSLKTPLFRGGGTIHGPKPKGKSVRTRLPKKVKRLVLEVVLAEKIRAEKLVVLERLEIAAPRTRLMVALLNALKLNGKVLLVAAEITGDVRLAARNIPGLALKSAGNVSAMDVLKARTVVLTRESLGPMGLAPEGQDAPAEGSVS
ncbi:MAG: 50S ribosomal protein L4 [Alphaproteobacteria bacterium]